jgi:hypothetical protein
MCQAEKNSVKVPELCESCGSKDSEWRNLSTGKIEHAKVDSHKIPTKVEVTHKPSEGKAAPSGIYMPRAVSPSPPITPSPDITPPPSVHISPPPSVPSYPPPYGSLVGYPYAYGISLREWFKSIFQDVSEMLKKDFLWLIVISIIIAFTLLKKIFSSSGQLLFWVFVEAGIFVGFAILDWKSSKSSSGALSVYRGLSRILALTAMLFIISLPMDLKSHEENKQAQSIADKPDDPSQDESRQPEQKTDNSKAPSTEISQETFRPIDDISKYIPEEKKNIFESFFYGIRKFFGLVEKKSFTFCRVKFNVTSLNVRIGPGSKSRVISKVTAGEKYFFIGMNEGNSWIQIKDINENTGWVSARYMEILTVEY